jgi:hypothetical protein
MKYNDYTPDFLTKDVLMQDEDFLGDASSFIYKRTGDVLTEPDEIYEKYLEHMRIHDVNEATTVQDLVYAERADEQSKAEMARLFHAYDKMDMFREGEGVADAFNRFTDYAEGLLTAPSTWVGLFTGGAGKAGAMAGQAVAKTAVRKALVSGLTKKGAKRAAIVEGTVAGVQDVGRQATQMELSEDTGVTIREEFSPLEAGINVTLSAGLGGVLGGASAYKNSMQEATAQRRAAIGAKNISKVVKEANLIAVETLATAKQVVRPIDELKVELGDKIRSEKMLSPLESTIAQLDDQTIDRIHAAATEFVDKITVKTYGDGTRQPITEAIADAIGTESLGVDRWNQVLDKYKLTPQQFGLVFAADVSRAARLMNKQSQIARIKNLAENINTISSRVEGSVGEEALAMYNAMPEAFAKVASTAQGFERMRRALLTSQIQTTVRNIVGGGARVFVDAMNTFSENTTRTIAEKLNIPYSGIKPRQGVGDIFKYMLDQQEAQVIVDAYSRQMPQDAQYLFSTFIDSSDVAARVGSGGKLEKVGTFWNILNRHADNYYKRAIFSGELNRLTKAKFDKDVIRMLQDGEFNKITPDMFKLASDKSLEMLYQKTPKNALAKAYLNLDKKAGIGMVTGLVMPFPRFVFNQVKFMTEYAPVIGLMMPGATTSEKIAKQLTGFGLVGGFALFRYTQGPTTNYFEYERENGQTADLRPMLAGLSIHAYLGDILYRMIAGEPNHVDSNSYGDMIKEIKELGLGTAFRAGVGTALTDRYIPDALGAVFGEGELDVSTARALGTMLGDYAATFAYSLPVGLARDLFQLTDEEVRQIGETREGVTFWEIFSMRSTRGLPEFMRPERSPRYEILSNIETRTEIPMAAATTGMNFQRAKNALEKEMTRLQLEAYDVYKPVPFGPADVAIRRELSKRLPQFGVEVIQSEPYKRARTDIEKKQILRENMQKYVNVVKENAFEDLRLKIRSGAEKRFTLDEVYQFEFESIGTKEDRKAFLPYFKERFGYEFNKDNPDMIEDGIIMLRDYIKGKPKVAMAKGGYVTKKYAEGGFVSDDPMMPRDVDDQMSELDLAKKKLPLSLQAYTALQEWKNNYVDDLAEVEKEFQSGERNIPEYILGTGYYGVAKPVEDAFSLLVPDEVEEAIGAGIQSFMDFTGASEVVENLSPSARRNLSEATGLLGLATPAKVARRQFVNDAGTSRAGREASSADVIIDNYYTSDVAKQKQMLGSGKVKKVFGDEAASKYNKVAGALNWASKAGKRVVNNMFNPYSRALYEEYGISPVFKDTYNVIKKQQEKLDQLKRDGAGEAEISKQQREITKALEVAQAQMQQMANIRQQARSVATVEDVPMRFALAAADPNVPQIYFKPTEIGKNWYEQTAATAPTARRNVDAQEAKTVQDHIEKAWEGSGLDMDRVRVIVKTPSAPMTGNHFASLSTTAQVNAIERAFRPSGGTGFVDYKLDSEGRLRSSGDVEKLKTALEKSNAESKAENKFSVLKTDDTGVWITFSHAGRGKVEGGVNLLVKVEPDGNLTGYASDLHDFLNKVPVVGAALNQALPTQVLAVTPPMQTNVFSISTLRTDMDQMKKIYGKDIEERFVDQPSVPDEATATAAKRRVEETANLKPSALGVAKETLPVARNLTFAANVLQEDEEQEEPRAKGGLMSRK